MFDIDIVKMFDNNISNNIIKYSNDINQIKLWQDFIIHIIKSFTVYGLLILLGVVLWKHAKADYEQAERLYSKIRQNRQLRLYIHLNKAKIDNKEYLNFLQSAQDEKNAYEDIKVEAKAPLGSLISDLLKTQNDIIKSLTSRKTE